LLSTTNKVEQAALERGFALYNGVRIGRRGISSFSAPGLPIAIHAHENHTEIHLRHDGKTAYV
jgi:hypothetical protein